MAKKKSAAAKARQRANRKANRATVRGRGDYDMVEEEIVPPRPAKGAASAAAVASLGKRVANLEKGKGSGGGGKGSNAYGTVGRDLGSLFGLGNIGEKLGNVAGNIFGHGDYEVVANSLVKPGSEKSFSTMPPSFEVSGSKHCVRIKRREYVTVLQASAGSTPTAFGSTPFRINPANPTLFPWLSQIAMDYDQWEPLGLVFELRSLSSDYATGVSLGVMGIALDYQNLDGVYTSKQEAEQSEGCVSAKPSSGIVFGAECDPAERPNRVLFVRNVGAIPTGGTANQYDLGVVEIFSQGINTASANLAELWVTYDFELRKAAPPPIFTLGGGNMYFANRTSVAAGAPLGTASASSYGSFGVTVDGTGKQLIFPAWFSGVAQVICAWNQVGAAFTNPATFTGSGNASVLSSGPNATLMSGTASTNTAVSWCSFVVSVSAPVGPAGGANYVTLGNATVSGASPVIYLWVFQLAGTNAADASAGWNALPAITTWNQSGTIAEWP